MYLSFVKVVDDLTTQTLLPLPFGLRRIMQELFQRLFIPVQQLPVQEQGEPGLCGHRSKVTCVTCFVGVCLCVFVYCTSVVLGLQVHLTQLVDVADVHFLLVDLRLVEVLTHKRSLRC